VTEIACGVAAGLHSSVHAQRLQRAVQAGRVDVGQPGAALQLPSANATE